MKKLQQNRGETLVEVLASILIASLSVALLFGCVMASSGMDRQAAELDGEHYKALTAAETQSEGVVVDDTVEYPKKNGKVTITGSAGVTDVTMDIELYGGAGMYSYKRAG